MSREFEPTQVEHDGKWVRAVKITCGNCNRVEKVRMNSVQQSGGDDSVRIARQAQRKIEQLNWYVGKRAQDDRCPICLAESVKANHQQVSKIALEAATNMEEPVLEKSNGASAPSPPQMTREDRRLIFAKLEECYENELIGYRVGWTDGRVAQDLGVPRAWVAEVRDQNFGAVADNSEIRAIVNEARGLLAETKEHCAVVQRIDAIISDKIKEVNKLGDDLKRVVSETQRLSSRVEPVERKLFNVEKSVR